MSQDSSASASRGKVAAATSRIAATVAQSALFNQNEDDDPVERVPETVGTIGLTNTTFLLINGIIGAGTLNFPQVYKYGGGILITFFIQCVFCVITLYGMLAANLVGKRFYNVVTMEDMINRTGGKYAAIACSVTVLLYSFGSCTTLLVIVGDKLDRVFYSKVGQNFCQHWYLRRQFTITVASLLFVVPIIFAKRMDFLTLPSKAGVFALFYLAIMVLYIYFHGAYKPGNIRTVPKSVNEITFILPIFCYAFHSHIQSVPIFACLKNKSDLRIIFIGIVSYVIACGIYSTVGITGYLTLGDDVLSNILLNYDPDDPEVLICIILITMKICFTYPLVSFCGRKAIINLLRSCTPIDAEEHELIIRICASGSFYLITLSLAVSVPNIGVTVGFVGLFGTFFTFIFPGLGQFLYVKANEVRCSTFLKTISIFLILFGLSIAVLAFVQSTRRVIDEFGLTKNKLCTA